jgi:hypothetical protein
VAGASLRGETTVWIWVRSYQIGCHLCNSSVLAMLAALPSFLAPEL